MDFDREQDRIRSLVHGVVDRCLCKSQEWGWEDHPHLRHILREPMVFLIMLDRRDLVEAVV